ncbi:urea transporter [Jejubacter calystegiae]|uniref:Urea transporter n=1 Tax=Jejubacter calystegiae TaxID=2579935 RepID=A0A4V1G890_9ENTR|nr:urea transporter [Jejubacter calystegiae]QCT22317.1 urea transporter [Jejubacter calystegiae]
MQLLLSWRRNPPGQILSWTLRGCSQVMFQNNPTCGLLFFIAIFLAAFQAGMPQIAWGCLLATVIATITAALQATDRAGLAQGLYGYNACLLGVALPTFLAPGPLMWCSIVFWSLLSPGITVALNRWLAPGPLPALTAPFVLASWVTLLGSYHFNALPPAHLPPPELPLARVFTDIPSLPGDLLREFLSGVSQVFLADNALSGTLILLGLAISSPRAMGYALLGAALALSIAWGLQAEPASLREGLYAFSAVLTAVALGSAFPVPGKSALPRCLAGILSTVLVQGAFNTLLAPFGIPSLTMPFVSVTWCYLLSAPGSEPTKERDCV